VTAFTGRRIVSYEWSTVPDGCEDEARRLASSDFVELQEQTEAKPEPVPFLESELAEEVNPPAVDLAALPVTELRQMAKERKVPGWGKKSKAQLVEALNE
jgi:hypothetical protein